MHPHSHDHDHHRHGQAPGAGRAFAIGIALNALFVLVEWDFRCHGQFAFADRRRNPQFQRRTGPRALRGGASALARRPPSTRFTYGLRARRCWQRWPNAMLLLVATGGYRVEEAILRFQNQGASMRRS